MPHLEQPLSHTHLHELRPEDDSTFPALTTSGSPTDAYQQATAAGLVSAAEAEEGTALSHISSRTAVGGELHDPEKGGKDDAKLVTWKGDDDHENPRNFPLWRKW